LGVTAGEHLKERLRDLHRADDYIEEIRGR